MMSNSLCEKDCFLGKSTILNQERKLPNCHFGFSRVFLHPEWFGSLKMFLYRFVYFKAKCLQEVQTCFLWCLMKTFFKTSVRNSHEKCCNVASTFLPLFTLTYMH